MTDEQAFDRTPLLEELRADTAVDAGSLDRVLGRVTSTLTTEHLAALGQGRAVDRTTSLKPHKRLLRASWTGLAAALAVGSALGAGGHAAVSAYLVPKQAHAPAPPSLPRKRPVAPLPMAAALTPPAKVSLPEAELPRSSAQVAATSRPLAGKPGSEPPGLDTELQQLEQARAALARGQAGQALSVLASHAQRFPRSMLAQERDALLVKALVAAGRYDAARAAGERFIARYPNGLLLDAVKASLGTIP